MEPEIATRKHNRELLAHWIWAVPILLVVAALGYRQIDLYPPTVDEFVSMYNAGWIVNSPFSPVDVLDSLQQNSANHTPLYFLILNLWGNLIKYDVAIGRTLTISAALLSLAMTYRLSRDFVAPVAGLFALIIVASNAFYNYYIPHMRMYPLLVFVSGLVFWLYLRIVHQLPTVKKADYVALAIGCYALANVHAFSALLFVSLGIYHLLLVQKNKRWIRVSLADSAAFLLFSPWIPVLITKGIDRTFDYWEQGTAGVKDIFEAWFTVTFNGNLVLLLVSLSGILIGLRRRLIRPQPFHFFFLLFLFVLGLVAQLTNALGVSSMRLTLPGWPPTILFLTAGLYALYRWRTWLGLFVTVWMLAGLVFQHTAVWRPYLEGRILNMGSPPWHAISRILQENSSSAPSISFKVEFPGLSWPGHIGYPQREYYFERHGNGFKYFDAIVSLQRHVSLLAITEPVFRLLYRAADIDNFEAIGLANLFEKANYELCWDAKLIQGIRIREYTWEALQCAEPAAKTTSQNDLVDYSFYGGDVNIEARRLTFADKWLALHEFDHKRLSFSHQLISDDWQNVAQVDLPLVHEDSLRQFSINISDVPAGNYRLMAILYDNQTGERFNWIDNPGDPLYMQVLTEVVIP